MSFAIVPRRSTHGPVTRSIVIRNLELGKGFLCVTRSSSPLTGRKSTRVDAFNFQSRALGSEILSLNTRQHSRFVITKINSSITSIVASNLQSRVTANLSVFSYSQRERERERGKKVSPTVMSQACAFCPGFIHLHQNPSLKEKEIGSVRSCCAPQKKRNAQPSVIAVQPNVRYSA